MKTRNARRQFGRHTGLGLYAVLGAATVVGCSKNDRVAQSDRDPIAEQEQTASQSEAVTTWTTDFFDDFLGTGLDPNNWQDQILWVNQELQCYDNGYNEGGSRKTVEVSNGALKLRVVNAGTSTSCANWDKNGVQHGPTQYRAGR